MTFTKNQKWNRRSGLGKSAYTTEFGEMFNQSIEDYLNSDDCKKIQGKVDLIFTSPPFPLLSPKAYGNSKGEEYLNWMASLAPKFRDLLSPTGSVVIEIGNAWEHKRPAMSLIPIQTLIEIAEKGPFSVCQQFICHNPARLPGPASWVTLKPIRLKDSFTHVWWYSATDYPKSDSNNVLLEYSKGMKALLKRQSYNAGLRPSGHEVSEKSFLKDRGGSIPPSALDMAGELNSFLSISNTRSNADYSKWCKSKDVPAHPARMQEVLAEFFIRFLTDENDLVLDPFGGSNTTGAVAEGLRRRWISVERDPEYVLGSMGRFQG